jgi:hypothetical protein
MVLSQRLLPKRPIKTRRKPGFGKIRRDTSAPAPKTPSFFTRIIAFCLFGENAKVEFAQLSRARQFYVIILAPMIKFHSRVFLNASMEGAQARRAAIGKPRATPWVGGKMEIGSPVRAQ